MNLRTAWVMGAAACILASGCVGEQFGEFRGTIKLADAVTNAGIHDISAYFQTLDPAFSNAVTGYGLSEGELIIIHDREKYVKNDDRLSTQDVSAVYFTEPESATVSTRTLQQLGPSASDKFPGVHRLRGTFRVEKWNENKVRVRFDMKSDEGAKPVEVQGMLVEGYRWKWNPLLYVGGILHLLL